MTLDLTFANALLTGIDETKSIEQWLVRPLAWGIENDIADYLAIARIDGGRPHILADDGDEPVWDIDAALTRCLDDRIIQYVESGLVVPIISRRTTPLVLIAQSTHFKSSNAYRQALVEDYADCLLEGIDSWILLDEQRGTLTRLSQILAIAVDWQETQSLDQLLESMAEAATQLLNSDRASIFLWDKHASELIAHPALGIEGEALRLPDNKGVIGSVLKSGEPRRWDRSSPSDEVDRSVDTASGYSTESLIAVPLLDRKAKTIGVFEVLNHREGKFSDSDLATLQELAKHAAAALANTQRMQQLVNTRDRLTRDASKQSPLVGTGDSITKLSQRIARVAPTDLAVLILGENGTGKEVTARRVHYESNRRHEPFVAVNCAAIAETLLESELFGHEKGAFTDAVESRKGKFQLANGGTLFLDEIGDMSLGGQAKLLRVLEEKVVVRVGGSQTIPVDVRVVAATNQNLVQLVEQKRFREDLYFRLTVVTLEVPPLRSRGDDIIELATFFLTSFCEKINRRVPTLTDKAQRQLRDHSWPGNVRELRNLIERLVYLTDDDTIDVASLDFVQSPSHRGNATDDSAGIDLLQPLANATADFQATVIERHIENCGGNMTEAAKSLGLQRSNLYRKIKQLGIQSDG
jgi:Nif-specific regulatory protein